MPKTVNHQLAKIHRNYRVEEAARLFRVHRNTVRHWIRRGLPVVTGRPALILGLDLRAFLHRQRNERKQRCGSGEIYCMRCRRPQKPAADMVEYEAFTPNQGRLVALCCGCGCVMYRNVNPTRLPLALASMLVALPVVEEDIVERTPPSVICDLKGVISE